MNNNKKNIKKGFFDELSAWECDKHQRHPLSTQITTRTIAGLLVVFLVWLGAKAKPEFTKERINETLGQVTITNKGLLPLNATYNVLSEDTSLVVPKGTAHLTVYPSGNKNIKILKVNNLPGATSAVLDVEGKGSLTVNDISGNTVILYPSDLLVGEKIK